MSGRASGGMWALGAIVVIVAIAAVFHVWRRPASAPLTAQPASATASTSATSAATPAHYPIGQAQVSPASASTAALPPLHDSDAVAADQLAALAGTSLANVLVNQAIIPRIVATINALPQRRVARNILPVKPPPGVFETHNADGRIVMATSNQARYAPYLKIVRDIDPHELVNWYVHDYPLFQQAWRNLGYPEGEFNDRLIAVIDHLLATPQPKQAPSLTPYKGGYAFVDPALESRSIGQKMLLRLGPAHEATIKAQLRVIRALLTGNAAIASRSASAPASASTSG